MKKSAAQAAAAIGQILQSNGGVRERTHTPRKIPEIMVSPLSTKLVRGQRAKNKRRGAKHKPPDEDRPVVNLVKIVQCQKQVAKTCTDEQRDDRHNCGLWRFDVTEQGDPSFGRYNGG